MRHVTSHPQYTLPNLQIRPYKLDVIPAILDLTRTTLGNSGAVQKTETFWHWKHQHNPFGRSYGLYAWDDQQQTMAGLRVLMRWNFHTPNGQVIRAVRAVDTATHPAYQRRGIFSTLTRQAIDELTDEGVHLIFNTPNQRSLPGYLKMGWQVVAQWPVYMKLLKPGRMLTRRLRWGPTSPPPNQFEAYFGPEILPWLAFSERYGQTITNLVTTGERQRQQVGFRTPRNPKYLQWRYGQHPHLTYGVYALEQAGELAGFAILRPNLRYGWQEIVLTELFLAQTKLKLGRLLIENLRPHLKGDYLVAHFAQGTIEKSIISRTGFVKVPQQGITLTTLPLNLPSSSILNSAAWDLTLGDLELF